MGLEEPYWDPSMDRTSFLSVFQVPFKILTGGKPPDAMMGIAGLEGVIAMTLHMVITLPP